MRRAWRIWVTSCVVAAVSACHAPSRDWNGTWKLNLTQTKFRGRVFTISIVPGNRYRFDVDSGVILDCSGKEQLIEGDRSRSCVQTANALTILQKKNGVTTTSTLDQLSTDRKTFTTTVTQFGPNGPLITSQTVYSRLSGENTFAGQWLDTSFLQQHADMIVRLDSQTLHIDYPMANQRIDAPLDGTDVPVRGGRSLPGSTYAASPAGIREFVFVSKVDGKVFSRGSLKLSYDGNTLINTSWNPAQPANVGTLVYDRR